MLAGAAGLDFAPDVWQPSRDRVQTTLIDASSSFGRRVTASKYCVKRITMSYGSKSTQFLKRCIISSLVCTVAVVLLRLSHGVLRFQQGETSRAYKILEKAKYLMPQNCQHWTRAAEVSWPYGMTTPSDLCLLYHLTLVTTGPILEQGSFVGLSATAIGLALKDKGVKRLFISNDLFPASYKDYDAGVYPASSSPYFWKTDPTDPLLVQEFVRDHFEVAISKEMYVSSFRDMLDTPGGQLHHMYANLHLNNLNKLVSIVAGEALPILDYGFVWSDAAHTSEEIAKNRAGWLEIASVHMKGNHVVWAFHDRVHDEHLREIDSIFTGAGHCILDRLHLGMIYVIEVKIKTQNCYR